MTTLKIKGKNKGILICFAILLILLLKPFDSYALNLELRWSAPATTVDGSALTGLDGFKIYYGTVSGNYTASIDVADAAQTYYSLSSIPDGTYYFVVAAYDADGNEGELSNEVNNANPAPVISNVLSSNITGSSVTIEWTTDLNSTSLVEYGLTSSYGSFTTLDSTLATIHSVGITGLSPYTAYSYRVISRTSSYNESASGNYSFTTSNISPAISSFTPDKTSGTAPLSVAFSATAADTDGSISSYEWDFDGDGAYDSNTGSISSTSYTYDSAGTYTPVVRVTDNGGATDTLTGSPITVSTPTNQPPTISAFSASPSTGEAPLLVTFSMSASDTDGAIALYEIDFDGNGTYDSSTLPATYTYTVAGSYTPRLRVTDDDDATATAQTTVTVSEGTNDDGNGDGDGTGDGDGDGTGNGDTGGASSSSGCFIATAAYGTHLDGHVKTLRDFRDEYLLTNSYGRRFVEFYYKNSPALASVISRHESLKTITRIALTPVVLTIEEPFSAMALAFSFASIAGVVIIRRRKPRG